LTFFSKHTTSCLRNHKKKKSASGRAFLATIKTESASDIDVTTAIAAPNSSLDLFDFLKPALIAHLVVDYSIMGILQTICGVFTAAKGVVQFLAVFFIFTIGKGTMFMPVLTMSVQMRWYYNYIRTRTVTIKLEK
jgi:hypothetical protein